MVKTRRRKADPPKYVCWDGPLDNMIVNMGKIGQDEPCAAFNLTGVREGCYVLGEGRYTWTPGARANHHGERVK